MPLILGSNDIGDLCNEKEKKKEKSITRLHPVSTLKSSSSSSTLSLALFLLVVVVAIQIVESFDCLQTNAELRAAVRAYVADPNSNSSVSKKYGYPIANWCVDNVTDFSQIFDGLSRFDEPLTKWNTSKATSMASMFRDAEWFDQDLSHFDTSRVETFAQMFRGADRFNQDVSMWNMTSAKYMSYMFFEAYDFRRDLCKWSVAAASNPFLDVQSMFTYTDCPNTTSPNLQAIPAGPLCFACTKINSGVKCTKIRSCLSKVRQQCTCSDINTNHTNTNTTNITNCIAEAVKTQCCGGKTKSSSQFVEKVRKRFKTRYCSVPVYPCFQSQRELRKAVKAYMDDPTNSSSKVATTYGYPIGNWCVDNVTDFSRIFEGFATFNEPLTKWKTSRATDMSKMFRFAAAFNQNLSHFDTSRVVNFQEMFQGAVVFNQDVSMWNMSSARNLAGMFQGLDKNKTITKMKFRQTLCLWSVQAASFDNVQDMFANTSCLDTSDPNLDAVPVSPLCVKCTNDGLTRKCYKTRECLKLVRAVCPGCDTVGTACVTRGIADQCCTSKPSPSFVDRVRTRYQRRYCPSG